MLPPLKSLILKWGLLAQWLYWAKYLQAILACPAIFLPGRGLFSFLLSGYGQFMLPASFLPLHGYWSLHFDLCPSYFHTCSSILFQIIPALFIFSAFTAFLLEGKKRFYLLLNFLSLPGKLIIQHIPEHPVSIILYTFPKMQALAHCFHINIFYRDYIVLVCDPAAQFMQIILSLVSLFFMASGNFLFLPHINLRLSFTHLDSLRLLPCQPFFIFSEEPCFFKLDLFWKHCHPLHRIINPQYFCIAVILYLLLGFRSCILHTAGLQNTFQMTPYWLSLISDDSFLQAPCVFSWRFILISEAGSGYLLPEYFRWPHLLCSCFGMMFWLETRKSNLRITEKVLICFLQMKLNIC